jgi:peptidoglycan/xylan/chitin deacetylase (PgdA/CDA1 family)
MLEFDSLSNRREFLAGTAAAGLMLAGAATRGRADQDKPANRQALIAITLDLEMSRNFPTWDQTHWDYEKGNLSAETKKYAVEAGRRVKEHGGVVHYFVVGRVLEQENVDWLKEIIHAGHAVGNHTYDHVNVTAKKLADVQFRFRRAPWLVQGQSPQQVIAENIRLTTAAMKERLGIEPAGFRTPGGFANGLADRPDVQRMLLDQGFTWVSSKYPAHPLGEPGQPVTKATLDAILARQTAAQPFTYPSGLREVPMSPVSDISAFRAGRWPLDSFLQAIRLAVEWAIENGAVFDLLCHPSCLYVTDPEFRTIELICDLVRKAGDRAKIVDLGTIANRLSSSPRPQNGVK